MVNSYYKYGCTNLHVCTYIRTYGRGTLAFYPMYQELHDYVFITDAYTVVYTTSTEHLSTITHHTTFRYLVSLALFDNYPLASYQRAPCCQCVDVRCCC